MDSAGGSDIPASNGRERYMKANFKGNAPFGTTQ